MRGAIVSAFGAPPIDGLGTTGGFKLIIEDRGNLGLDDLQRVSDQIVERGNRTPGLQGLFNSSRANTPWLYLDIDRTKCMALGVPVSELFNTLQVYLGSYYVNNFNEFGRTWQVNVQADQQLPRRRPRHPAASGAEQPGADDPAGHAAGRAQHQRAGDGACATTCTPPTAITGNPAPGTSSGEAIALMQEIADKELPRSMASDWTELAYLQLQAGNTAIVRLRAGGGVRLPGAGGPVRELEAAAGGHPGRADVPALLARRRATWPAWT